MGASYSFPEGPEWAKNRSSRSKDLDILGGAGHLIAHRPEIVSDNSRQGGGEKGRILSLQAGITSFICMELYA